LHLQEQTSTVAPTPNRPAMSWGDRAFGMTLASLVTLVGGCQLLPGDVRRIGESEQVKVGSIEDRGAWLFWPATIRVHPLTSVLRTGDEPATIDLRVEAVDAIGEPTRAVGTFVVVLSSSEGQPTEQRWKVEVDSLEAHRARFDPVTETYRLTITPEWTTIPATGTKLGVKVILFAADGATPTATADVTW
jgi:hypothetical protein